MYTARAIFMSGTSPCEKHRLEIHWLNYYKLFNFLYVLSSNVYFSLRGLAFFVFIGIWLQVSRKSSQSRIHTLNRSVSAQIWKDPVILIRGWLLLPYLLRLLTTQQSLCRFTDSSNTAAMVDGQTEKKNLQEKYSDFLLATELIFQPQIHPGSGTWSIHLSKH